MKRTIKLLTVFATVVLLSSFTNPNANEFIGTYGVSESDPSQIKLVINSDHTFYYQDFSIPEKKVITQASWTLKGKKVVLQSNAADKKIPSVWAFVQDGQVAKSHHGFTFYRLCKIE